MINFLLPKLKFTNVSWKLLKKRQISFVWYVHKIFWWKTNVSYALIGARTYQGARGKKCQCFENFSYLLMNDPIWTIFGAAQIYLIVFYFVSVFLYLTIKFQNSDEVLRDRDKVLRKFFSEVGLMLFFNMGTLLSLRSSRLDILYKIGVLKKRAKFTRKQLCHSLLFKKVTACRPATLLKRIKTSAQMFYSKIFKNVFL